MRVIFLDIDGVLNCWETTERWRGFIGIDPKLAQRLAELVRVTSAKVVLSSTWRRDPDWLKTMQANHVVGLIDRTPLLPNRPRGEEIDLWLHEHPEVERYAIIDDDSDMLDEQMSSYFRTSFYEDGLTEEIARMVEQHFNANTGARLTN
jgi:hypothetical protein